MFRAIAGIASFVGVVIGILVGLQALGVCRPSGSSPPPPNSNTCKQGFVWREAGPDDHVCVIPDHRSQAALDNRLAAQRHVQGSDTCLQGFVWREAFSGDHVCVTAAIRDQTALDNSQGPGRVAGAG